MRQFSWDCRPVSFQRLVGSLAGTEVLQTTRPPCLPVVGAYLQKEGTDAGKGVGFPTVHSCIAAKPWSGARIAGNALEDDEEVCNHANITSCYDRWDAHLNLDTKPPHVYVTPVHAVLHGMATLCRRCKSTRSISLHTATKCVMNMHHR